MSCQYHKTVTLNISVTQSSESQTHGTATPPDFPPAIESKNPLCHMTMQYGTQTSVNKMQVLHHVRYVKLFTCLTAQF